MSTKMRHLALIATLVLAETIHAASFKVIVNNGTRVEAMSKKAVADLFMKRATKWQDGTPVVAVDQAPTSAVREQFSRAVHGKPTAAVKSYWNQQIFSGRGVPPVEMKSDAEVIAFVRTSAGAVGYVSEAAPTDGVRVVPLQQ
jgi:ABC-type phosphate transport system substrate-binding protein